MRFECMRRPLSLPLTRRDSALFSPDPALLSPYSHPRVNTPPGEEPPDPVGCERAVKLREALRGHAQEFGQDARVHCADVATSIELKHLS